MQRTFLSLLVLLIVLLPGCSYVALVKSTETRTQSTAHVSGTSLVVQGVNGSIDIIAEPDRDDVYISAEISTGGITQQEADDRLTKAQLSVTRDTNRTLTVTTEFPSPTSSGDQANITIRIPSAADVQVTNVNGSVSIQGMSATMKVNTSNGRVNLEDAQGEVRITTVNGRVTVERHSGVVIARTTNGRVSLSDLDGSADVNTVNGRVSVTMTDDAVGPLQLQTTNGRIEAVVGAAFAGEVEARVGNGSVTLSDDADLFAMHVTERRSAKVKFSAEGASSSLRTSNGSITLKTR